MQIPSRLKNVSMEEIPNISSDIIEKLKELNIDSVCQLAVQSPIELAIEFEDALSNAESAATLIANARKLLKENSILTNEFTTADEVLQRRDKMPRYATGSDSFDSFLNGGFESQAITEIAGEFGTGKSQICHTLCVAANRLIENGQPKGSESTSTAGNIIRKYLQSR
jgi:DNA repair protein RadA